MPIKILYYFRNVVNDINVCSFTNKKITLVVTTYSGVNSGEPPVRVENAWPAIISNDTFQMVQHKMALKRPKVIHPRTVPSFYLLLSGIIFCSCGQAMIGRSTKSHQYYYYMCNRRYKQGEDACAAKIIPKDKLERLVIEQLKARALTDDNLEQMGKMVNQELRSASSELHDRLDTCDMQLTEIKSRLSRLYDVLETGKLSLDELSPRIREFKKRQDELDKTRIQIEADMIVKGVEEVDMDMVKSYTRDLKALIEESDIAERKSFLRSFIKPIEINRNEVVIHYHLPLPQNEKGEGIGSSAYGKPLVGLG